MQDSVTVPPKLRPVTLRFGSPRYSQYCKDTGGYAKSVADPGMHRQTQAGCECVFRLDAETQADVSDGELGAFPRPQSCFD